MNLRPLLLLLVLLMTACAGAPKAPKTDPQLPYPPPRPPAVGDILHLPTGFYVTEGAMLQAVGDARIAYVGETHDNPASHRLELAVLQAMAERWPGEVALAMEMFTPSQQPALDRWVAGELDEKEFIKTSGWYQNWRMDFDYYRELLLFARERKIPVLGINAEKSLVKALRERPAAELAPELQTQVPEMDLDDPYQSALVEAIFGGHAHGNSDLSGFLRVQTLWDETMAANIAGFLGEHREMRLVVVAGGNHVRYGFGIPRRVFRRLPTSYVLVATQEIEIPEEKRGELMDVELPSFPMPPYHFLTYSRYESLDKEEVRLGVLLEEGEAAEVRVKGVLPESAAALAGVQEGDRILAIDGSAVTESFDLIYVVKQKRPGDRARLQIGRDGQELLIEAVFPPAGETRPHGTR
ncbi:MAG: ChaN family lipoprotein [Desulfuromonadales bacterium]|nr:ChaN family lipoprotein [Desulfuromonadales bacterium]